MIMRGEGCQQSSWLCEENSHRGKTNVSHEIEREREC